jgi:hypothetical protein
MGFLLNSWVVELGIVVPLVNKLSFYICDNQRGLLLTKAHIGQTQVFFVHLVGKDEECDSRVNANQVDVCLEAHRTKIRPDKGIQFIVFTNH